MSRKGWKGVERTAAALMGGKRFPANMGGPLDFEGPKWVGQVKNVVRISLHEIERLAVEAEGLGAAQGKKGVLVVKRSAGKGITTPHLIVMTEDVWRAVNADTP